MSKTWAEEQAKTIGAAVSKLRGERSGQWLSDETARTGHRIPRTTISELENGKRKAVSTAELCLLAWALKVPPVRLLYPKLPDGPVEIVPGQTVSSIVAATWFSGETLFTPELVARADAADVDEWDRDAQHAIDVTQGARLVDRARRRFTLESGIKSLAALIARLRASEDPSLADPLVPEITKAEAEIGAINAELRQVDGAVVNDAG